MVGSRLEVGRPRRHGAGGRDPEIVTCMNKAGIEVVQLVLEQFAAAEAVLTPDEKELGIAPDRHRGRNDELAVYQKGTIAHTAVVPIGGDHFTNDLAVVLRAPITDAERFKKKYGCARGAPVAEDDMVEVRWSAAARQSSARARLPSTSSSPGPRSCSDSLHETSSGSASTRRSARGSF